MPNSVMSAPASFIRSVSHLLAAVFNDRSEFERCWKTYRVPTSGADPFEGQWVGEWQSEANGHRGELRCLLTHTEPEVWQARFHATYARVLRVCYSVLLKASGAGETLRLKGEADLGMLAGGIYEYEGQLSAEMFNSKYRCKYDHGTFTLKRLKSGA